MMDALFISFSGFFVLLENQKVSEKVSKRYRIESKGLNHFGVPDLKIWMEILFVCLFVWKKLLYSKWLSTCFLWWICSWSQKGSALSPESFQITDKKTCKVCDLSSPLYSMVGFNTVRSVKDCPTAYRLRLVPWHH